MDEKKKEIAFAIEVFIWKRQVNSPEIEWPEWRFKIRGVKNVKIDEQSLKNYGERWTFEGSAILGETDDRGTTPVDSARMIVGSAVVGAYPKDGNQNDLFPIKKVTITKIKKYEKQIF